MSVDVATLLVKNLPKSLTLASGDTFSIEWVDGLTRHEEETPPYASFSPVSKVPQRPSDIALTGKITEDRKQTTDTITFKSGTDIYQVTERDILDLNSVTGTFNGSSHEFTIDGDVEKFSTANYETYDSVKWMDSGDKPDDGTDFTVDYDHRIYKIHRRNYERLTYRLAVHAKDLDSNHSSASKRYAAWDLAHQLGDALVEELTLLKGSALDNDGNLKFKDFEDYGSINLEEGESTAVNVFDITMTRWKDIFEADARSIENIIQQTDVAVVSGSTYGTAEYGSDGYN